MHVVQILIIAFSRDSFNSPKQESLLAGYNSKGNYQDLDKTQVKLFPANFTSIRFDYLLTSWVTNYAHNLGFLKCLPFIVLQALKSLELKVWLSLEFFNKILDTILLCMVCHVFRFSRASFNALASSFIIFQHRCHLSTETYGHCHGNFVISLVKL